MIFTIDLENDLYAAAEAIAQRTHSSVEAVLSQVLREGLAVIPQLGAFPRPTPSHFTLDSQTGFPVVKCDRTLTSDDVERIESDAL